MVYFLIDRRITSTYQTASKKCLQNEKKNASKMLLTASRWGGISVYWTLFTSAFFVLSHFEWIG